MLNSKLFKIANETTKDKFMLQVIGIAEEYDEIDWDMANQKMQDLYDVCNLSVKEIRDNLRMTQEAFSEFMMIPISTIRNWEQGMRKCPEYVRFYMLINSKLFDR